MFSSESQIQVMFQWLAPSLRKSLFTFCAADKISSGEKNVVLFFTLLSVSEFYAFKIFTDN